MENEIELKIMILPELVKPLQQWLQTQHILSHQRQMLGNTYYDTPTRDFAKQQMGLRVRNKNQQYELTLKTKGDISGGLHIRPEYNLPLADEKPDFKRLVSHFNLQNEFNHLLAQPLTKTFSTDFVREAYLITHQNAQIEIALDQGKIINQTGEAEICELELELKKGTLTELFDFLNLLPKQNGMWLSGLTKAHRGYLVGNPQKIEQEIEQLIAEFHQHTAPSERLVFQQKLVDLILFLPANTRLLNLFNQVNKTNFIEWKLLKDFLLCEDYFRESIKLLNSSII